MELLGEIPARGHEQVSFFHDHKSGVTAIIAVHSTVIGPSLGGCRMRKYASLDDALFDVLRLSEAMSFKNSLCGINVGGGKSVLVADHRMREGRDALFQTFGQWVDSLGGRYIAAEDMGTSVEDMTSISKRTKHIAGTDPKTGGGGDPSPYTAKGIFLGIQACAERSFGSKDLAGKHVALQGVGHVGSYLAGYLHEAGAKLTIADPNEESVRRVAEEYGAKIVPIDQITSVPCDIFSPNAVGGTINESTVKILQCKVVAGGANNQILESSSGNVERELQNRGISYVPDFAINAGGVILCADEFEPGGFTPARVNERVARIYQTVGNILDEAKRTGEPAGSVAVRLAKERIEQVRNERSA